MDKQKALIIEDIKKVAEALIDDINFLVCERKWKSKLKSVSRNKIRDGRKNKKLKDYGYSAKII